MQIDRLLEIVYILLDKKSITARELAEHFEVSPRTIYRDVDTLSAAGIPVYTNKGKGGGICLLDTFVLNKSILSEKEQMDILSSLQGLNALNVPGIGQVLNKLSTIFGKTATDWIDVDFSYWGSDNQEREKFELLKKGIFSSVLIEFDYISARNESSKRIVEPIQIFFKDKSWYLRAYCTQRQDFRTFKVIRMKNVALTRKTFTRKEPKVQTVQFTNENVVTLKLKFSKQISYRVYDEFIHEAITENADGSITVTLNFPEDEWVYAFILSFGAWCEVLEPPHIREIIKNRLAEGLKIYS